MNAKLVEGIANAVLYEGYMLYPYRPSALKNRQRWNFGVLYPRPWAEIQKGADSWRMQTECLAYGSNAAVVEIRVRFLQAISRQIGKPLPGKASDTSPQNAEPKFEFVESLQVGDKALCSWQEAMERDVVIPTTRLADLPAGPLKQNFNFTATREIEPIKDETGSVAAFIVRTRENISGSVELRAEERASGLVQLTVVISNLTPLADAPLAPREDVLLKSLLSAHTVLGLRDGEFVSLIDPPETLRRIASECKNEGTWPVLIGEEGSKNAMLSSPIILYDYPQIAPESPGNLFDGAEIDEILALRILTLSDDEKCEIQQTDDRTREVLQRTESLPEDQLLKLHGVLRGMRPLAGIGHSPADHATDDPVGEDQR